MYCVPRQNYIKESRFFFLQVESFILDQEDPDDSDPGLDTSRFLLRSETEAGMEGTDLRSVDPETQARLEALLEAAGKCNFLHISLPPLWFVPDNMSGSNRLVPDKSQLVPDNVLVHPLILRLASLLGKIYFGVDSWIFSCWLP
jgi:hypothetical protein